MDVSEAIHKRRSVRAFSQEPIDRQVLGELVEAARVAPSAANRQPLEYVLVTEPGLLEEVFACLKWAAYIAPAGDPPPGRRPTAYLVVLRRTELELEGQTEYDVGAALASVLLLAVARGLGCCWLRAVNFPRVSKLLQVPEGFKVDSVVAMGRPAEEPSRVDLAPADDGLEVIRYWRDEEGRHFVPKRALERILHWERYGG